jgi:hypothetical protein
MNTKWDELAGLNLEGATYVFDEGHYTSSGVLGRVVIDGDQVIVQNSDGRAVASCSTDWGTWHRRASGQLRIAIPMVGSLTITPTR